MEKLVTIVIPVLNREDTLPRLFESLKAVTYTNLETIFVDNGSTDHSQELILSFSPREGNDVRLMFCQKRGAAAARNVGLEAAKGEYICFFDSDDEMSPTFIGDMVEMLESTGAELAVARTLCVFANGRTMVRARGGNTLKAHIIAQGLNTASWVARKELVIRAGKWNEELLYWDDYELGVRLLIGNRKTAWSDKVYHRTHEYDGTRLTTTAGQLRVERSLKALEAIKRDIAALPHLQSAYNLRSAIVRGQLERLGLDASSINCHGFLPNLLRLYTRLGGRGAWRLAILVTKDLGDFTKYLD